MQHTFIKPQELRNSWEYIKTGLAKILKKSPENWIPEDIYTDCYNGNSHIVLFTKDSKALGFAVLQKRNTDMHIWCAYSHVNNQMQEAWKHLKQIARESKADRITFDSWRKGWEKHSKKLGMKPRTYYMEI